MWLCAARRSWISSSVAARTDGSFDDMLGNLHGQRKEAYQHPVLSGSIHSNAVTDFARSFADGQRRTIGTHRWGSFEGDVELDDVGGDSGDEFSVLLVAASAVTGASTSLSHAREGRRLLGAWTLVSGWFIRISLSNSGKQWRRLPSRKHEGI